MQARYIRTDLRSGGRIGMTREEKLKMKVEQLEKDKKNLMNRCFVYTGGFMCQYCGFNEDCENSKPKNDYQKHKVRDRSNIFR